MCAKLRSKTTESVNQSYYIDLDTGERFLRNRIFLWELSEWLNLDILKEDFIGIGKKPRWDNSGTVVDKNGDHQSYYVDLDTGERLLCNRIYLGELSETHDLLKEDFIHECVSNLPRRSERIAARMNQ